MAVSGNELPIKFTIDQGYPTDRDIFEDVYTIIHAVAARYQKPTTVVILDKRKLNKTVARSVDLSKIFNMLFSDPKFSLKPSNINLIFKDRDKTKSYKYIIRLNLPAGTGCKVDNDPFNNIVAIRKICESLKIHERLKAILDVGYNDNVRNNLQQAIVRELIEAFHTYLESIRKVHAAIPPAASSHHQPGLESKVVSGVETASSTSYAAAAMASDVSVMAPISVLPARAQGLEIPLTDAVQGESVDKFFFAYCELHNLSARGVKEITFTDKRSEGVRGGLHIIQDLVTVFTKYPFLRPKNTIIHFQDCGTNPHPPVTLQDGIVSVGGNIDTKPFATTTLFKGLYEFFVYAIYPEPNKKQMAKLLTRGVINQRNPFMLKGLNYLGVIDDFFTRVGNVKQNTASAVPAIEKRDDRLKPAPVTAPQVSPPGALDSKYGTGTAFLGSISGRVVSERSSVAPQHSPTVSVAPLLALRASAMPVTPLQPQYASKYEAIIALRGYKIARDQEGEYGRFGIFACFTTMTKTVKFGAVNKMIAHLEGKRCEAFSQIELEALMDEGTGGKGLKSIVKRYILDKNIAPKQLTDMINKSKQDVLDFIRNFKGI